MMRFRFVLLPLLFFLVSSLIFWERAYPFQVTLAPLASGLSTPVAMTHAGDGSGRLFVVEQRGIVKIIKGGALQPVPFLDITDRVLSGDERGLLSIAFPPGFSSKGYFYVNYTGSPDGRTIISRFRATVNPDIADPNSEEVILTVQQPFANHNGGQIAFSPRDGYLYIGMGDGGSGGDPQNFAQNLNELPGNMKLLGKMLRIDVESGAAPYSIPSNNPILNGVRSEIWALGLRNPWRFSFDRITHDLYIGDVGQGSREEINFQSALSQGGENYGWRILEGSLCFNPPVGCAPPANYSPPVTEYGRTEGCSVTGGVVYRGVKLSFIQGSYFFGDFCTGKIWMLKRIGSLWGKNLLIDTPFQISAFGEDELGDIYVADYSTGRIFKIVISDMSVDFDGDGKTDVLWQHTVSGTVALWMMDGATISSIGVPGAVPPDWQIKGVGDFNGDGKSDVLWQHPASGTVAIWIMDGATISSIGVPGAVPTDWQIKGVGDFNGDAKSDVLWQHTVSGTVALWMMDGATISSIGVPGAVPPDWQIKGVGDFNGDAKSDVLWQHLSTGTVAIWMMDGVTISSVGVPDAVPTDWQIKGVGDFNGDAKSDILWQHPATGTVAAWIMDGVTISSIGVLGAIPSDWQIKGIGDFDGNGKSDVLWQHPTSGTVALWMMDGATISSIGVPGAVPTDWQIMN